jgi:protein subunit release factor B
MNEEKQRITIASKKDFEVSYYCGSGPGGTNRNKQATGVQIKHAESGAIGRRSDSRSQVENRKNAFNSLIATSQFKFWLAKKRFEIEQQQTLEESVEQDTIDRNLKYEIKDENGHWVEVSPEYFNTPKAKEEI